MNALKIATLTATAAVALGTAALAAHAQYGQYGPPPQRYYNNGYNGAWDQVPPEFAAMQQRGFRDGIEGAKRDFKNHRPPNVYNRDEFRNPHFIPPPDRHDYLVGFERGYNVGVRHIYGAQPNYGPQGYRPY